MNGFRARILCLTRPGVVQARNPAFDGNVCWVGVTCNTTYELDNGGPFVHRRILFKSTIPWPVGEPRPSGPNPAGGIGPGEYIRTTAQPLSDLVTTQCLRTLFTTDTVRGAISGPVATKGVTVLKDESFTMRGQDDGVRRKKKYWNALKGEPRMQYTLLPDGGFDAQPANSPASQHIYLVDIYSYGLKDLDVSLPDLRTQSADPPSGAKRGVSSPMQPPSGKRTKSEDSNMSGTGGSEPFSFVGVRENLPGGGSLSDPMVNENKSDGKASIVTEMKLYYKLM